MSAIDEQAKRVLALFGEHVDRVITTVGAEQEYFLISEKDYAKRSDLIMTGRTLFGYSPLKGQELEEHYFGAIRPDGQRVHEGTRRASCGSWACRQRPSTTRSPLRSMSWPRIYTNGNRRYRREPPDHGEDAACWQAITAWSACSMRSRSRASTAPASTTTGPSPPARPTSWIPATPPWTTCEFLVFLTGVIQAVDDYAGPAAHDRGLLRQRPSSGRQRGPAGYRVHLPGRRAGAPSWTRWLTIMSTLAADKVSCRPGCSRFCRTSCKDNTDRNRTSPFAFTGNKFEFRMPGSAVNLSRLQHGAQHRHGQVAEGLRRRHGGQVRRRVRQSAAIALHQAHDAEEAPAASSSTATVTPTSGPPRPSAAAWPTSRTTADALPALR